MPRLPRLTARESAAVLERIGFSLTRQSGSHKIYKNAAGKRATVPFHTSKILSQTQQQSDCKRED